VKAAAKWILLLLGLGLVAWYIWRAGPAEIFANVGRLGWWAPLVLLPYFVVYLWDSFGWYLAFGQFPEARPRFPVLFRVRWAGEAINNILPTGYIGGEALKVYLLHKRGVPTFASSASVVTSKTCQVLSQVIFIGLGALCASDNLPDEPRTRRVMLGVALAAFAAIGLMFAIQRRGIFSTLQGALARISHRIRRLDTWRPKLRALDERIFAFYHRSPLRFLKTTSALLAGWLCDSVEIFFVCRLLGLELEPSQAIAIESLLTVAKGIGFFVPGALGVQESGLLLLFRLFHLPEPIALAYAIIRRGRDMIFVTIGALLLYSEQGRFSLRRAGLTDPFTASR
jgi:putative membrane protein